MTSPNTDLPPVPGPHAETEPVLSAATVVTVVTALLVLLTAFGLPLEKSQEVAILGFVAVIAPLVLGMLARRRAWAPATVAKVVAAERQNAVQGRPMGGS